MGSVSTRTRARSSTVAVPHEGKEEYNNIWQKTRANWRYIAEYYLAEYDFFVFGGDDLYVIPSNLKAYLASPEIAAVHTQGQPLFLGRRFKQNGNMDKLFNSGGSGYILNKASLAVLYDSLDEPFCRPHLHGFWEDVMVAECLKNGPLRLLPYDTRDAQGRERFHPFSPGQHLTYRAPKNRDSDWYTKYSIDLKEGEDCCSPSSVAFHYIKPDLMRHMDAIIHDCKK